LYIEPFSFPKRFSGVNTSDNLLNTRSLYSFSASSDFVFADSSAAVRVAVFVASVFAFLAAVAAINSSAAFLFSVSFVPIF